jgi:hypothetical protein
LRFFSSPAWGPSGLPSNGYQGLLPHA